MKISPESNVHHIIAYESRIELQQDGGIAMYPPREMHHLLRQLDGYNVRIELCVVAKPNDPVISIVRMVAAAMDLKEQFAKTEKKL